jgi:hypothetical protein
MENQNIFNKILLLFILLLVANYLSGGSMYDVIKKYFIEFTNNFSMSFKNINENFQNEGWQGKLFNGLKINSSTTPKIVHDADFKQNYQKNYESKDDPLMRKLYHFLQSLVTTNNNYYELTASSGKSVNMSSNDKQDLTKHLLKSFNCGEFKFNNFVILDSIIYFENPRGKEIRPFRISADVYINKKPIGKITLHLEMFIRLDNTFYGPFKSGFPSITRIKLIRKDKISSDAAILDDSYDNDDNLNASDNSLIPDSINFSTEDSGPGDYEDDEDDEESDSE